MRHLLLVAVCTGLGTLSGQCCAAQTPDSLATLVIYRPFKLFGWGINYDLQLNGQELCRLSNRRYLVVQAPPGEATLHSVPTGVGFWPSQGQAERTLRLPVQAGHTYYVHGSTGYWSSALELVAVPAEYAKARLRRISQPDHCSQVRYAGQ